MAAGMVEQLPARRCGGNVARHRGDARNGACELGQPFGAPGRGEHTGPPRRQLDRHRAANTRRAARDEHAQARDPPPPRAVISRG